MKTVKRKISAGYSMLSLFLFLLQLIYTSDNLSAQTLYVDGVKGKAGATGTIDHPIASLEEAIGKSNSFTGLKPVCLKLAPGTYPLMHEVNIKTALLTIDTIPYTIEAMVMPDDKNWEQFKMPIILSMSSNSRLTPFPCAIGFSIGKDNVSFRGLKFIGNSNANAAGYYPIQRGNPKLTGLNISQCYFIGKKEGVPIEGSLWLTGEGIHIDHCIFSSCKTSIILYGAVNDFSLTYSIISGSYESAIWFAGYGNPFVFSNNVIINSNYVMVHPENKPLDYTFRNSNIAGNQHYIGAYAPSKDKQAPIPFPADDSSIKENKVDKTAEIELMEATKDGIPHAYLNLSPGSAAKNTQAGIFKKGN